MPKTSKKTIDPSATMASPVLLTADGTPKAPQSDQPARLPGQVAGESVAEMVARQVSLGVATALASQVKTNAEDTFTDHQLAISDNFSADLTNAVVTLGNLFDIDIEQTRPDEMPVQYAQRALFRDLCYLSKRNIDYNTETLKQKASQLQRMVNRHDGSSDYDEKVQNMATYMKGLEDQLDLWTLFHESCIFAHFSKVGEEWGAPVKRKNVNGVTAAAAEAAKIASRHLSQKPRSQEARDKGERDEQAAEIDLLKRALADAHAE